MRIADLPARLRAAGLTVVELDGWVDNAVVDPRTQRPYPWSPGGVMVHEDIITPGNARRIAEFLAFKGRSDLRAPLYQAWVDRGGVWWMLAGGNANHAGWCDRRALERLLRDEPPGPVHGRKYDVVLNGQLFGVCLAHHPDVDVGYPPAQLASLATGVAVVRRDEGWSTNRVIRHGEGTARKPDTRLPGRTLRQLVDEQYERLVGPVHEEDDVNRICIPSWAKRQPRTNLAQGYRLDVDPRTPTEAIVCAFHGAPLTKRTGVFGVPFVRLTGLDGRAVAVVEIESTGAVVVVTEHVKQYDVAARPKGA